MTIDQRCDSHAGCDSYGPGHMLHWTQWKRAASTPGVPVTRVIQDGPALELVISGGQSLHWCHHDPSALAAALEKAQSGIEVCPEWRALRVDGHWFNCAPQESDFTLCG
jgi:hypothetical protein